MPRPQCDTETVANDHYVSQTHLRGWQDDDELLNAVRKSDLGTFRPKTDRVCGSIDGNTNDYLNDPRAVEDIIRPIECGYARAVETVQLSPDDAESILVLAGWIAYVRTCSPAAMRIAASGLDPIVEEAAKHVDATGVIPPAPSKLGDMSASELLSRGDVKLLVDPKFAQAMGVDDFDERVRAYSNCRWQFLHSDHCDSPFFTSDYPIVSEPAGARHLFNTVVPLSPTLSVRMIPWMDPREVRQAATLSNFKYAVRGLSRKEVRGINAMIVRAAENIVIYRDAREWVLPFVRKHAAFRTVSRTDRLPTPDGTYIVSRTLIEPLRGRSRSTMNEA